jgi:hypothetical protein
MALVVETGTGSATSEAYASVADTNAYVLLYTKESTWTDSLDEQKEQALRLATQTIDARNYGRWQGTPSSSVQALSWPRADVEVDSFVISSNAIPRNLKRATMELAVRYRIEPGVALIPDDTLPGNIVEERVKVGDIEETIKYVGGKGKGTVYTLVDTMLAPLTTGGVANVMGTMERA